jgi:radical SAM superfamily enzyme YgiQ (UPF0313 family)
MERARRFQLVLIKPSRYDDDGYIVQWMRSSIPSNSLAVLYSIADDCATRRVLGPGVEIDLTVLDEINTRIRPKRIAALLQRHGGLGLVALVGVQSNQFSRALDIARPLREAGLPVIVGGFHVSGCLAMLPRLPPDLQQALDLGISLFAGESEGRFDRVLKDAAEGRLAPVYNHLDDLPSIEAAPLPYLPPEKIERTMNQYASFDAGRGCPFQCSFCTIINVQGRKSRRRTAGDVEEVIRKHYACGIKRFFITDDNFARNKDWEQILDRLILLRERDKMNLGFVLQVDTLCHKIPNFIEKSARAGVKRIFIGLENINPANLLEAKKRQNKITEYRAMLLAWKKAGVVTYAGYILGFPGDTPESIREDIAILKRELPVDIISFYLLTPLPGSEDHKVLWQKGAWLDPDMNKYDLEHVVCAHPKMSTDAWTAIYREAWATYYTFEHMDTILRRGVAHGIRNGRLLGILAVYSRCIAWEGVNPLQAGIVRRKSRRDRRPGLPIEPVWTFYPKYLWSLLTFAGKFGWHLAKLEYMRRRAIRDQRRRPYMDQALTEVSEDEASTLALFTHNRAARSAVERTRAALTGQARRAPR